MDTSCFAFGPSGSHIYNTPKQWKWRNLPQKVSTLTHQFKDITWAAFGETADSYFISYVNKDDKNIMMYGSGVPAAFKAWLTDPDTGKIRRNKHTRVTFGPNDGFVAWDSTSIRWSKIPEGLEGVLQGWLSPAGWSGGPPRIIALGKDQAYLAISEYGVWAYRNLPGDMRAEMTMCGKDLEKIKCATLSMFGPHYVAIVDEGFYCYEVPDGDKEEQQEAICIVLDSFADEATAAARKASREEARSRKYAEDAKKRVEEAQVAQQARYAYTQWAAQCDIYFTSTALRTSFKHPPQSMCKCREVACLTYKEAENSLGACKHDMEALFRGSDCYSLAWLRKERLRWHPDKFVTRCDSIYKQELLKKATQMYAIYEELIQDEIAKTESNGV